MKFHGVVPACVTPRTVRRGSPSISSLETGAVQAQMVVTDHSRSIRSPFDRPRTSFLTQNVRPDEVQCGLVPYHSMAQPASCALLEYAVTPDPRSNTTGG